MPLRNWIIVLVICAGVLAGWGMQRARRARSAPVTPQIAALLEQKNYAAAVPLLQARFEEVRRDRKAAAQVKTLLGQCARELEKQATASVATQIGVPEADLDPSTGARRVPHAAPRPDEVRALTVKQLGNFTYDAEKGGVIPPDVKALHGRKVRLTGYMIPLSQAQYISEFALVPSLTGCCFGQPPGVQHVVTVRLPKGKAVEFTVFPVSVLGTLQVDERRKDNFTESIFEMNATSVKITKEDF